MAVAPLQIPGYSGSSSVDLATPLANLGQQYKQAQQDAIRRETLAQLGQGNGQIDPRALLASGDMSLANLGLQIQNQNTANTRDARDFAFRQEEAKRAQSNADRSYGLQARAAARADDKTPSGFTQDPTTGGVKPIAGGPADPNYIQASAAAKPRQLSISDITKLSDEGNKYSNLTTFSDTFKPEYAGHTVLGDAVNTAGRNLPEGIVGKTASEGASWWQGYDRYKNVVRNELFGSALTAPEKAAFEKADINPRMDPSQVQKNLATQRQIAENGLRRKANAMIAAGYSPKQVSAAYGVNVEGGMPPAPEAAPSPSQAAPKAPAVGELRDGYRFKGGNPGDPNSWLKVQ